MAFHLVKPTRMKTISRLAFIILFAAFSACSSPKKTPAEKPAPKISKEDLLRGGTTYSNAVVIQVTTERAGLDEEYKWLSKNYPGYSLVRRRQATHDAKHFDIVRIRTREGQLRDVYFNSTAFAGRK